MHELMEMQQDQAFGSPPVIPDHQSILNRLARIESALGITEDSQDPEDEVSLSHGASPDEDMDAVPLHGVWTALAHLRVITRPPPDDSVWSRSAVQQLWSSYVLCKSRCEGRYLTMLQLLEKPPTSSLPSRP